MAYEVFDFISYLKKPPKRFDKDLFQSKLNELANAVDTTGLVYEDFHTLFQVWLDSSLLITKWKKLGSCLAPPDIVQKKTVQYAFRWILTNLHVKNISARIGFLLDWLTVAMEFESIDMKALHSGYYIFHKLLTIDGLTVHAAKLVYKMAKPTYVTRNSVITLLKYACKNRTNKRVFQPLQVILGLFKSYKPDCMQERIFAFPITKAFMKPNKSLCTRYINIQDRRNKVSTTPWTNPINSERGRNEKAESTNEFYNFSESGALLQASAQGCMTRPVGLLAQQLALLCRDTGDTMLALMPPAQQASFAQHLSDLLFTCFMEASCYTYSEKEDLLQRLVHFQCSLLQGVSTITCFLAYYLPHWNELDYFPQILDLCEWVSALRPEHVSQIAGALSAACLRAPLARRVALLRSLTYMYTHLLYSRNKSQQLFLPQSTPEPANYDIVIPALAQSISTLCHELMLVDSKTWSLMQACMWSALQRARAELREGAPLGAFPSRLTLAVPLLSASGKLIDQLAELALLYMKIMAKTTIENSQKEYITRYLHDFVNCFYSEKLLSDRLNGLIFTDVELNEFHISDMDAELSLRNNVAFALYTYPSQENKNLDNKALVHVLQWEYPHLALLLKNLIPELRQL